MKSLLRKLCLFFILGQAAALPAQAQEVVLYSSNHVETVNLVLDAFKKQQPGIKVSVVRAGTGALMQRIKAEAANPLGDIFWSGGLSTISEFKEQLTPYESAAASAIAPEFRGPGALWLGTNTHVSVLMANTRQLPGGQLPSSWVELADPKWKGKIVVPDPERSSSSFVALYGIQKLLGAEMLAKIVRNSVVVGTTSGAYEGVAKGEFALAITMEYAAYEYVAGGMKEVKIVYPKEGTFLSPEGMALIKGGKNADAARKLYDFLASKDAQSLIFKSAYRRPLRTDIDVSTMSELPKMSAIKIISLDDAAMGADRNVFLTQWRQIISAR